MSGLVDLHLHLLWDVDDGCRTADDSLALAKTLVELGFTEAAPSPHNRAEYAPLATCVQRLEAVRALLATHRVPLTLYQNSENFFLDENLLVNVKTDAFRPIGDSGKYLLIEAPYQTPLPKLLDVVFRLKLKQVTPMIAHPERCLEFERKGRAEEVVAAGAVLQLDVGALIGRYGPTAESLARTFLKQGLYAVAATDAHSPTKAKEWIEKSLAALTKTVGHQQFAKLFAENPRRILAGESLS
jgi:protein-tyrosine phosphatase